MIVCCPADTIELPAQQGDRFMVRWRFNEGCRASSLANIYIGCQFEGTQAIGQLQIATTIRSVGQSFRIPLQFPPMSPFISRHLTRWCSSTF